MTSIETFCKIMKTNKNMVIYFYCCHFIGLAHCKLLIRTIISLLLVSAVTRIQTVIFFLYEDIAIVR